ncbi:MAG: hypothetical protein A2Y91_02490 [Chloroflexi bacterium RBG_13_54_8]|nr:MAG: hypothetical protein A2Y91_02490 [Chloroflexi bacterium RBG_13_54_8]
MSTKKAQITSIAISIVKSQPSGVRYSELSRRIQEQLPGVSLNTIHGTIWNLDARMPGDVYKPDRGVFRHTSFGNAERVTQEQEPVAAVEKMKEGDFYKPFADWLVNELEECTKAIALGGNRFRDKWGTPDVIGIREPRKSDIVKPPTEIVSAEIKADSSNLITAFGQACSYKLFSHRSYIVIPGESSNEDTARLDALGRCFGIGLILFDSGNPKIPRFEIRVRAAKHEPDMFYVNKYMKLVEDDLFS